MDVKTKNKQIAAQTKEKNIPFILNNEAMYGLINRLAGKKYADSFLFSQIEPLHPGMDRYRVSDTEDGKVLIEATSGVAAANAFRWYIENRCDSYVGPLNRRLNFPAVPPEVGESHSDESIFLYRYCLNYCTFGYTFLFWDWEKWEPFIDWLMLAGYNLILNPIGTESVWLMALQQLGYTLEEAKTFVCSPAFFPWQCMNNISTWSGAAWDNYYLKRLTLAKKINARIRSFGGQIVAPGWSGMVPQDFQEHFKDSNPHHQGLWCGMPRPSIITQEDPKFAAVAYYFYKSQKELLGEFNYFSTDPFHEGGDSSNVDLAKYAQACLKQMQEFSTHPVWFLQGWGSNPVRTLLKALPVENVLIGDLLTWKQENNDNFADYPWLCGTVDNFGGQRRIRGNLNALIKTPLVLAQDDFRTVVGVSMFPEGMETDEMMFDIIADYAVSTMQQDPDDWLRKRLRIRYGADSEAAFEGWQCIRDQIYNGEEPRDSGLLSRPSLHVAHVIAQVFQLTYDQNALIAAFCKLLEDYDILCSSEAYRMDIMDIGRQIIGNAAWEPIKDIQESYFTKDLKRFEDSAALLMMYYDLQEALLATDRHSLLGPWLEMARAEGNTPAQKAYMEFQARTIITLWGDQAGSPELHDYAAREWDGMLQDFYRPRWQSFINILRCSLVTGNKPMDYDRHSSEYFFTTLSKNYSTKPYGNMKTALLNIRNTFKV